MSFFRRWSSTYSTLESSGGGSNFIDVPVDPASDPQEGDILVWDGDNFTDGELN